MAKFIAELGSNHNGDFNRLADLVDAAAEVGCDGVKVQLFDSDKVFAPEVPHRIERRAWNWPDGWIAPIACYCKEKELEFGASVYSLDDVAIAAQWCDFLKISSYDILRLDLIRACNDTGKPLVISTGMATRPEIQRVADTAARDAVYLHCVSLYPTPPEQCALKWITSLPGRRGYSDHTRDQRVIAMAVGLGAELIEFHLDLEDKAGWEYGGHCWVPSEAQEMIHFCNEAMSEKYWADEKESDWRADPSDGLRPMKSIRGTL